MEMTTAPSETPNVTIPAKLHPPIAVGHIRNEKGVKQIIKELLNAHGWYTWMPAANGFGTQGVSDHLAIKDGVFLAVEAKFGTNKPSAMQTTFAGYVIANDFYAFCVNERNIDHLAWFLESFEIAKQCQMMKQEIPADHGARMLNAISVLTDAYK